MYKSKKQRKQARWARNKQHTNNKYASHLWFQQLVKAYGFKHAAVMALDAEKSEEFTPRVNAGTSEVVVWSGTSFQYNWSKLGF